MPITNAGERETSQSNVIKLRSVQTRNDSTRKRKNEDDSLDHIRRTRSSSRVSKVHLVHEHKHPGNSYNLEENEASLASFRGKQGDMVSELEI